MIVTRTKKKIRHSIPCERIDDILRIDKKLDRLDITINGNGDGIGMKTDLCLVVEKVVSIEKELSVQSQINNELEIQRRVNVEIEKMKKENNNSGNKKKSGVKQTIGVIIAALMLVASIILGIMNYAN
jgi:hypothetical protein